MNSIQSNGYGFGNLFEHEGGLGRIMGNGHLSASIQGGKDTSATFAADVVSRITPPKPEDLQDPAAIEQLQQQFGDDTGDLAGSLQRTVEFVQERYGKHAATAVMGMVYNRIGNGEVTEESLGAGLLDSVKFIDRNFGMAEGDNLMNFLNDDLNAEMNDFFDNGLEERFFAATPGMTSLSQSFSTALGKVTETAGQDAADNVLSILEKAMEDTNNPEQSLKLALEEADKLLAEQGNTPFTAILAQNVGLGASAVEPQVGTLLNITV
ncbi:hypothetical protein LN040_12820 [Desulfovibrio subterraneus]|jgi:hypothetical protein|uniref:Uncharacterized protein n=1 Tax=Desulfovibrio subterraneus TaxID=2718620 RepID=A0A7J0BM19_9BACT|nr:hypothetical protein [Desulfovibrio subterraneus]WBF66606.1 hypothetical protein LN040_12820 [Desulfovibrio subterraneus]GFM34726.1 hypothetical protein DSM101010T_30910 [Desulfovibrio subterraneus]